MTIAYRFLTSNCFVVLLASALYAQDPAPLHVSAIVQGNYAWSSGAAAGNPDPSLGFLKDTGHIRLTEATVSISGDWDRVGFRIDGGGGDFYKAAMAADSWKGPNQYVTQAFVFFKPSAAVPLRVEAGKFFSSVGAEVPESNEDYNISRSLLFWYASPLYHVGVRASAPIGKNFTAGAQLLSGCNTVTGSHGHQSMAFTLARTGERWGFNQIYIGGNDKPEGRGWRELSDTVVTFKASDHLSGYGEVLGVLEKRTGTGYDRWYGVATAWRFVPREKWAISPRVEWFNDANGATTGLAQRMQEFTLTGEYRPVKYAMARVEYRSEWSSQPFYGTAGSLTPARNRQTLMAGITLLFDHGL